MAAKRGHIRVVDFLVGKGADIDIQDKDRVIMHDYSWTNDSVVLLIDFEFSKF